MTKISAGHGLAHPAPLPQAGILQQKKVMLNRRLTIAILSGISLFTLFSIALKYGLSSMNNWLLILSVGFMCLGAYRVLGMVEGYKE